MYVKPYIDYLIQFHRERDYFECHEILEEYWKKDNAPTREVWVVLIQYAVALYHHRIQNFKGAEKMICSATSKLVNNTDSLLTLGLDPIQLKKDFIQLETRLTNKQNYTSPNLPFLDKGLEEYLLFTSQQSHHSFYQQSPLDKTSLIYKHTLRDRSIVIAQRQESLKRKKGHN